MTIHLFNPENDLALASGIDRYTPPAAAVALARCGALIPAWLSRAGDKVMVVDEAAMLAADNLHSRFGLDFEPVTHIPSDAVSFAPWGWSRNARRRFIEAGASPGNLPDDSWLERHRAASSRLSTLTLSSILGLEPPVAARDEASALAAVAANSFRGLESYLKMPWSSSGRGVFTTSRMSPAQIGRRVADIIRAQGAVIIEPDRHRVSDFATLYRIEGGVARFHALSAFATDSRGAYRGNLVVTDDAIVDRLGVDPYPWVERVGSALPSVVPEGYEGWAGVDMVVTDRATIYPLIELNLRATMGVVAAAMRPYFDRPMLLAPSPLNSRSYLPLEL